MKYYRNSFITLAPGDSGESFSSQNFLEKPIFFKIQISLSSQIRQALQHFQHLNSPFGAIS
jgi:hypothetical protein